MSLLDILSKPREEEKTKSEPQPDSIAPKPAKLVPRAVRAKHVPTSSTAKSSKPNAPLATSLPKSVPPSLVSPSIQLHSVVTPQETPISVPEIGDIFSLNNLPDLYDPQHPNNYYVAVYQPSMKALDDKRAEASTRANEMDVDHLESGNSESSTPFGEKMLYKQGWKGNGYGLGKSEQGRVTPLKHTETLSASSSRPIGIIVDEPLRSETSRVILLRNMAARGQVDEMLADDTKEECSSFGTVLHFVIEESSDRDTYSDSQAVRIFVQFRDSRGAERAITALNGRTFDGRIVLASLYPEAAFSERKYWLPVR